MIREILSRRVNGIVRITLGLPEEFRSLYEEMPPIFKHVEVSRFHLPALTSRYAQAHNLLLQPQKFLCSSFFGEKLVLSTTYVRYLVKEFHCKIHYIDLVVQFQTGHPFENFIKEQTDKRRQGDALGNELISSVAKLFINSSYGRYFCNFAYYKDC